MEPEKNNPEDTENKEAPAAEPSAEATPASSDTQQAPVDALSKTPEELTEEAAQAAAANPNTKPAEEVKKLPFIKRVFRKVNVYVLIFLLLVIVAGAIAAVMYFNSQKPPEVPDVSSQTLSEDALKQLANTDASVGNTSQTLTIQGNAIIQGEALTRGALNVAGNFQTGGSIQGPALTISGQSNLGATQINSLQVASDTALQGSVTIGNLNVSGTTTLNGDVNAGKLTVSQLIMSGNAVLQVPNHISFTGASPGRSINAGVLGGGGSASVNGSDTTGTININSGSNPGTGCFVTLTFSQAFTNQPHVLVTPIGSAAGRLDYYVSRDKNSFSICTNNAAQSNQVFAFDYFVTN